MIKKFARVLLFLVLVCSVLSFRTSTVLTRRSPHCRAKQLKSNKLDSITINKDLKPLSNNILVKVKEIPKSTPGGLYIPENAQVRPSEGVVVAIGPGKANPETGAISSILVKVGDNVVYGKYDGTQLKYNNKHHQLIKDEDVLMTYSGSEMSVSSLQCTSDHVLIKLLPKEQSSQSGIILSASTQDSTSINGVVVRVGPGRLARNGKFIPMQVQQGDSVRFRDLGGDRLKLDGQDYVVVTAEDVLAAW